MTLSRRSFLGATGLAGLAWPAGRLDLPLAGEAGTQQIADVLARPNGAPEDVATNEAYWRRVASQYRVSKQFTNLEAGYFGMMAAPVLAAYHRNIDRVNQESSYYARRQFPADVEAARAHTAAFLGAAPSEIVFSRGATEALQCLIGQYNRLKPGDAVMYADLDYNAMQFAMNWLAERRGATVATLTIPEPATRDNVLAAYKTALDANPRVRLLLLTHLNNKTGLILPVKDIVRMARDRGADVIVDAAHSFGQVQLTLDDLGADFVGCNLHKWIGAPIGVGVMYIKTSRIGDIDRMMADESNPAAGIDSRIHSGTTNFATVLTVPAALDFHDAVGPAYKAARLRYLRDRWVRAVRDVPGIQVLTPDDRDLTAGISSFRIHGRTTRADNEALAAELLEKYKLFTFWRTGLANGDCVRATPALYNTPDDADRLAAALKAIAARG